MTRAFFLTLLLSLPVPALAQDRVPPLRPPTALTLREALRRAHDRAPQVLAAIARTVGSRAQVDITRSALWPTLSTTVGGSASVSQSTSAGQIVTGTSGSMATGTYPGALFAVTGSLNASWTIWDFGRTDEAVRVWTAESRATQGDLDDARRVAMQAVAAAFYGVLADAQIVAAEFAIVEQRARQLEITAGLVEVGSHPPIESTRSRVALSAAQLDLRIAQGTLSSDTATLAAALALDPATQVEVVAPPPLAVSDDPVQAAADALRARPDVRAAQLRIDEARANVRLARAAWMPTLAANAALTGRLNDSLGARDCVVSPLTGLSTCASGATTGTETTNTTSAIGIASAGVSLTVPLVDESISLRAQAAQASLDAQEDNLNLLLLSVRANAVQAALSSRNAQAALAQSQDLAEQAAANLAQAEGRYRAGAAPLLELVDAEAADASARITVVRLHAAYELAKVQLLAATGRLDRLAR